MGRLGLPIMNRRARPIGEQYALTHTTRKINDRWRPMYILLYYFYFHLNNRFTDLIILITH